MFEWLKSTRSIAVVIVLMTLSIALFMNKVDPKDYMVIASAIVTAYFGKRDTLENQGGETTSTLTQTTKTKKE